MADAVPDFTPVNLITGALGSGKTTLLSRLLRDPALRDTAVLINEFGEVGLDHHLIERVDETMVLLQSGCLCCTIRGELAEAIRNLHAKRDSGLVSPFRKLVIESTGLADPFPILSTIHADPVLKHHFRLGSVLAAVDAVNGWDQLDTQVESLKQAAAADRIALTKTDLATPEQSHALAARLRSLNPSARLWLAAEDPLDPLALLPDDPFDLGAKSSEAQLWFSAEGRHSAHLQHEHAHDVNRHGDVAAFSLIFDAPLDWTMFGVWLTMLLNRHGTDVLRVKGILNVSGSATPVAIHGVQHLVHPPRHMAVWPDDDRRSRIVFIVRHLDAATIRRSLAAFTGLAAPARIAETV